jgi:putative protease
VRARVEFSPDGIGLTLTDEQGVTASAQAVGEFVAPLDAARMECTVREQIAKSGEMPFHVDVVEISGPVAFSPVSALNALRREAMERLLAAREATVPPRDLRVENREAPYPATELGGEVNITNTLAAQFYRDHRVRAFAPPYELAGDLGGAEVMRTPYCIRRETGACLRGKYGAGKGGRTAVALPSGPLYLVRGGKRYRLEFDCDKCEMTLTYERP